MTHNNRLKKLFEDHYNGHPWLDVTILDTIHDITAIEAATQINGLNSIWQILKHMLEWRKTNLKRVNGKILSAPSNNFIFEILDPSENAWKKLKSDFNTSQIEWLLFIQDFDAKKFDIVYEANQHTYYEHIQGVLQHDVYHLGQIVLIKKMLRL